MNKKGFVQIGIILICVVLTSCQNTMKPDTPATTGILMKLAISNGEYERFNALFSE